MLFDILDYIVSQGNMNIWVSISSKNFITFLLDILKVQNSSEIQNKLLQLLQKWGLYFEKKKVVIPNFYKIYNKFKENGVKFPYQEELNNYKYTLNSQAFIQKNKDNFEDIFENENIQDDGNEKDFSYQPFIKNQLDALNFEIKYRRIVVFLLNIQDNIKWANLFINKRKLNELEETIN